MQKLEKQNNAIVGIKNIDQTQKTCALEGFQTQRHINLTENIKCRDRIDAGEILYDDNLGPM